LDFELEASIEYHKAVTGAPGKPRRKRMAMKDDQFNTIKDMYLSNEITIDVYAKRCTPLMFMQLKKKKERSVDEEEDEDEDRDEEEEDGDSSESLNTKVNSLSIVTVGCNCNTACKTIRCACKLEKRVCSEHCHLNNSKCQNK
jgi:hypothetical protein